MRRADIPLLVWHILGQLGVTLRRKIERVPAPTMERLVRYDWPGNIRELKNVLERAVILSPGSTLVLDDLADTRTATATTMRAGASQTGAGTSEQLETVERDHILRVLDACDWRVRGAGHAAERLGLKREHPVLADEEARHPPIDRPRRARSR
jgi:DNA-binding NtrC family response regulator